MQFLYFSWGIPSVKQIPHEISLVLDKYIAMHYDSVKCTWMWRKIIPSPLWGVLLLHIDVGIQGVTTTTLSHLHKSLLAGTASSVSLTFEWASCHRERTQSDPYTSTCWELGKLKQRKTITSMDNPVRNSLKIYLLTRPVHSSCSREINSMRITILQRTWEIL